MSRIPSFCARLLALAALLTFVAIAPASAVSAKTYEKQVISSTNALRTQNGKVVVTSQTCVDRWAQGQATWMAKHDRLEHRQGRLRKIMRSCKLTGASENIAWSFSNGNKAVAAWAKSAPHRKNMLASKMRYIGVGFARSSSGEIYVAQVFGTRK